MLKKDQLKQIVACHRPKCSCPILEMNDKDCTLTITDDYKGKVILTYEEMTILSREFLKYV
jgi:hypothetical protein